MDTSTTVGTTALAHGATGNLTGFVSGTAPTLDRIVELGYAYWGARALHAAVDLGVFTELARGPFDVDALRVRVGLHPRGARDFFDALAALGMLQRRGGLYSNSREADLFLDRAKPSYIGGLLQLAARIYSSWGSLTRALQTGEPQTPKDGGGRRLRAGSGHAGAR